jgi:hypothetical protein
MAIIAVVERRAMLFPLHAGVGRTRRVDSRRRWGAVGARMGAFTCAFTQRRPGV